MDIFREKRRKPSEWDMQASEAETQNNKALLPNFPKHFEAESKRRKQQSPPCGAMLPTNSSWQEVCLNKCKATNSSWQEVCLNKCKAMPDSEEKYQELKELAKSFQNQKRLAASLEDSENEHICDYYLQKTQQAINALSPEYELAERARIIEQADREREELRALREKEERRPGRPAPSVLFDSDQLFARGLLSRERKEEDSPPRSNNAIIMELTDGWQKRYWDYYKAMPNSKEMLSKERAPNREG